ncbi:MAG TPA: hypothetical protein GX501_03270 [Clostridiaceae bacterium]|nr:hypothetical protein [Clostridiaceae bacterium]
MDWSRAKTILIIVLLLLNIFLLAMNIFRNPASLFTDNYRKYALDYLSSRDISIDTKIPDLSGQAAKIMFTTKEFDPQKLCRIVFGENMPVSFNGDTFDVNWGEESVTLTWDELKITDRLSDGRDLYASPEKFRERVRKYLAEIGYKNVIAGETGDEDGVIRASFNLEFEKNIVFDHVITAEINSEGLLTVSAPARDISKGNGKSDILSLYQVLVTGGLSPGTRITDVGFGYKQVSEGDIYGIPVWRVILGDGTVLYYNAYTGSRLE